MLGALKALSIRRVFLALLGLMGLLASTSAAAGALGVQLVDGGGRPIADAVVILKPVNGAAPKPRVEGNYRVTQQNITFSPFVSIVPVGATVAFPNFDPFRHHVYSFSQAKRFELKLFAKDQTRKITFDRPGIVSIGCNIHDSMSAFIVVADSLWTARTTSTGIVRFGDLPGGDYVIQIWHPYLRAPGGILAVRRSVSGSDRTEKIMLSLRPPPMPNMSGY